MNGKKIGDYTMLIRECIDEIYPLYESQRPQDSEYYARMLRELKELLHLMQY